MKPGYFVAILIMLFIIGEHFVKNKQSSGKKIVVVVIAAIVAGAFAGFALEWALSIFRTFMQANVEGSKHIEDSTIVASTAE